MCLGQNFYISFPCLNTMLSQSELIIGYTITEPSLIQWNISFMKAGLLFHVHSSMLSLLKWGSCKPLSMRNNKRLVESRFALLLYRAFHKGVVENAVFQNPVLTS